MGRETWERTGVEGTGVEGTDGITTKLSRAELGFKVRGACTSTLSLVVIPSVPRTPIYVSSSNKTKFAAKLAFTHPTLDFAIFKVQGAGFVPVHLADTPPKIGSDVIGIGYPVGMSGDSAETAFVGAVASVDAQHIYFTSNISPGSSGGPLFDNSGAVIGLMTGHNESVAIATRTDVVLDYIRLSGIWVSR